MSTDSIVRARISEDIKEEAALVLAAMGFTLSDAVRMLFYFVLLVKKQCHLSRLSQMIKQLKP